MLAADSEVLLDGSDFQDYVFVSVCVWDRDISLVSGFEFTDMKIAISPGHPSQVLRWLATCYPPPAPKACAGNGKRKRE